MKSLMKIVAGVCVLATATFAGAWDKIAIEPGPWQLGDLNCDGVVDFDDIDPFVLALSDKMAYARRYACSWYNGDCNQDGKLDFDDIDPFVDLLSKDGPPRGIVTVASAPSDNYEDDIWVNLLLYDGYDCWEVYFFLAYDPECYTITGHTWRSELCYEMHWEIDEYPLGLPFGMHRVIAYAARREDYATECDGSLYRAFQGPGSWDGILKIHCTRTDDCDDSSWTWNAPPTGVNCIRPEPPYWCHEMTWVNKPGDPK